MNWLITGGCGFLGTSLIKKLVDQGKNNIRIIDNLSVGTENDLGLVCKFQKKSASEITKVYSSSEVELVIGNILDDELALKVTEGADIIVHFAANTGVGPSVQSPRIDMETNVIGVFNYLEAARTHSIKRFIFASSGAPVGEVDPPIHEELPPHPVSPYGASKLAGEGYCSSYNKTFNLDTVILRFGNVYGPGSLHKSSVVAKFILQAINKETLEIFGDGGQTRDFIYVDDLIDAVLLASKIESIGGEIFQIASNNETTVNEIANLIRETLKNYGLSGVKISNSNKRLGDVMRNYSDTRKAESILGWSSKVKLTTGIKKTVEYFLK